jgi:hypothetical protein
MTTSEQPIRISQHAEQRRHERRVLIESVHDAVLSGKAVRTATGWRYVGADGTHVITDPSSTLVVTVLGRRERPAHDRDGAGLSRYRQDRPPTRPDQRCPSR